ncbi:MAG: ABC transporter ATP-binding protein [Eubacteriales bacterium]|nr:ABC transporter ATP-binding protein [Eubacteriales bacterium]MDD4540730.1 ABC transporter ATP-binding protein [Eubacteriales bacterium]
MKERIIDVEVIDLVKRYKELVAVDHLSLSIEQGEIFGLLGPNGSGKTTLINCMLALLSYDQGEVKIFAKPMTPKSYDVKQQIGLVPQEISVYEELTVYDNIDYFCGLYVEDKEERRQRVEEVIDFVQLDSFRKFHPRKLSGGLKRRLNLACGIAHRPRLIFLDEPTVAVDPQSRNRILEGIKYLRDQGSTIVYTTHYMEEVEYLCDRLAILDHGKILVSGTNEEIISMSSISESIEIVVYDLPESIIDELRNNPSVDSLTYQSGTLSMAMKQGDSNLLSVLHLLTEEGLEPVSVSGKNPTLNDVFLEITGKELRDNA